VDSLLAIIGPAGTDISGIATNFKADKTEESESVSEAKTGYNSNYKFCGTRRSY
jgi:pyruvate dehydrogenase E2 component (dihydrolipoamide acetyltransferase)